MLWLTPQTCLLPGCQGYPPNAAWNHEERTNQYDFVLSFLTGKSENMLLIFTCRWISPTQLSTGFHTSCPSFGLNRHQEKHMTYE